MSEYTKQGALTSINITHHSYPRVGEGGERREGGGGREGEGGRGREGRARGREGEGGRGREKKSRDESFCHIITTSC